MEPARRTPTDAELVELHDRLWNDPRCRDDRSEFRECDSCGRATRWIANLGSPTGASMQIVARPVSSAAFVDPVEHAGLVAVWPDRTGFTISSATHRDELEGAFAYPCHWDVCADARRLRDRLGRHRARRELASASDPEQDPELLRRYVAWRRASASGASESR